MCGYKIRQFRKEKGYSQKDLAQILGVTTRTVSRWEQNNNRPSSEEFEKIAKLMGMTVKELEDDSPDDICSNQQNVLDKIFDGVDNLVSGQESINENLILVRNEYIKRQDKVISELNNQNEVLISEISSYKNELDTIRRDSLHRKIRTIAVIVTCLIILALILGTWMYWRNYGNRSGVLVGTDEMGTPSYFENGDE